MNTVQSLEVSVGSIDSTLAAFRTDRERAGNTGPGTAPCVDIPLERLQQNTSRKERFIYSKQIETDNSLKPASNRKGTESSHLPDGLIPIHKAQHAAVGEFLGVVAHKCRQPLNSIAMIIHNMVDAWKFGELNDALMERSELRAMEQISLLTRTIDDLRSFLDPDSTTESFDPVESVKVVVAQMTSWFSGTSTIEIRNMCTPDRSYRAGGCQNAFERVIVNLLCNANDAIEERQRRSAPSNGVITIILTCSDENIVITVEDTGGGIEHKNVARVFEPYFTTKQKGAGFGMGLYLSKLVIENSMNGTLIFENIPDGARLSILLPTLPQENMYT